jgi:hypothetical protein
MTQLTIANQTYPIAYPVAALTRVLRTLGININQLNELSISTDYEEKLKFIAVVAWSGLVSGAKRSNVSEPFKTPDELLEYVETLNDLIPALPLFSDACNKFSGADEAKEQPADPAETEAPNTGELLPPTV